MHTLHRLLSFLGLRSKPDVPGSCGHEACNPAMHDPLRQDLVFFEVQLLAGVRHKVCDANAQLFPELEISSRLLVPWGFLACLVP